MSELDNVLEAIEVGVHSPQVSNAEAEKFFWGYEPWGFQTEFHQSTNRLRATFCGNRVGKTTCGVMEAFIIATGNVPHKMKDWFPKEKLCPPNGIVWLCTQTEPMIESITLSKINECIPLDNWGIKYLSNKKQFILPDGKKIFLKSYEQGWQSFQGAGVHFILFDEECNDKKVYTECMTRLLDTRGYLAMTMTPLQGKSWTYYDIYERSQYDTGITIFKANMYEAPHLDNDAIDEMLARYPEHEKRARAYGEFAVSADKRFFNPVNVHNWVSNLIPCTTTLSVGIAGETHGNITDLKLPLDVVEVHEPCLINGENVNEEGIVQVWEYPKMGIGYVLGVDVASGEGSQTDHSVCHVKTVSANGSIRHVATLRSNKIKPYDYGRLCMWLARYYNNGLIIAESEGLGLAFLSAIEFYPYAWRSEVYNGARDKMGIVMTSKRYKVMENERDLVENRNMPIVLERETLAEMGLFVYSDKKDSRGNFKPDHVKGGRSDGIIASALADYVLIDFPTRVRDCSVREVKQERNYRYPEDAPKERRGYLGNKHRVRR